MMLEASKVITSLFSSLQISHLNHGGIDPRDGLAVWYCAYCYSAEYLSFQTRRHEGDPEDAHGYTVESFWCWYECDVVVQYLLESR